MPLIDITTKGRIRLTLNGVEISQHVVETEAIERALLHASTAGDGTYVLKYPEKHLRVVGTLAPVDGSVDTTRPSDVGTLTQNGIGATFVSFSWGAATDNVAVTGYQVFDNGAPIGTTASTSYTASGLTPSSAHSFQVQAFDAAGNVSLNLSPALSVTTNANAAPSWNTAQQELTTGNAFSLLLTSICSDADSNPLTFSVVSGTLPTGLTFNSVAKTVSGTPTTVQTSAVVFRASDGITTTDATITFRVLNADTTAPTTPGQPTSSNVGSNSAQLSWSAVSDQTVANARTSGLGGYKLYRDGGLRADVGNVTTYADTGMSSSTTYDYTVSAYDLAGNESAQSTARSVTTTSSVLTQAQDWINRSTAAGVVQAKRFTSSADLGNTTNGPLWPNGLQSYMAVATRGGIIGDGYLRKTIPGSQGETTAHMVWPLNASWNTNGQTFGLGNKWYAQWRFVVGPTLIRDTDNNGSGLKICNIGLYNFSSFSSSSSAPDNEIVVYVNHGGYGGALGRLNAYRFNGDYDSFRDDAALLTAENQFYVREQEWIDLQIEVTVAVMGAATGASPGNTFTLKAKRAFESAWTTVFDAANFSIGTDTLHQAFWDTGGYDTNRKAPGDDGYNAADPNFNSWWGTDQLIVSTSPIAAPMPKYTVPSWFTGAADSTFGIIPGTATGTIQAVQQGGLPSPESIVTAYGGSPVINLDTMELELTGSGGHGDYAGNESYACPITGETNAFYRVTNYTATGAVDTSINSTGATSAGSMGTTHTYGNVDWFEGRTYFTCLASISDSGAGNSSSAVWSWSRDDIANGRIGYTYHGKGNPTWSGSVYDCNLFEANNVVDPIGRDIWQIPIAVSSPNNTCWKINHDTQAITSYSFGIPYGFFPDWVVCVPHLNILLAGAFSRSFSPGLWRLELENPTSGWKSCIYSGAPQGQIGDAAVFHQYAGSYGKVYLWRGGTTLHTLSIPLSRGGTFAFGSAALSGTAPTPVTATGTWKKMRLVETFSTQAMLVFLNAYNEGLRYIKVPSGGF